MGKFKLLFERFAVAELELSIHYKTLPNRIGFGIMCLALPFWALFIPVCLGLFISMLLSHPGSIPANLTFWTLLWLSAIPILSVVLTAFFEDDRIYISKNGIAFPPFILPFLGFKRNRSWAELSSANIYETGDTNRKDLLLKFGPKTSLAFNMQYMAPADLEQLLLSIELWGTNCNRSPQLISFQNELQNKNIGITQISYTQMWEEELSRRFNATSFIPLDPEHLLQSGQLKVIRQIAFGGLSAIYLAQKNNTDLVVLKEAVLPANADPSTRRKAEEHFNREAQLLIQLDHRHIAKVLDHFVEDGRNYLIIEYINGQDLRQYIKQNGAQKESIVLQWAVQIASIIKHLHSQTPPIIHRDLTPDNLVLQNDGTVILIDFGAANHFVGTATGTLVGKQAYIAPEQLRGKSNLASDLYSFAGTLNFLLTGQDPLPLSVAHPKDISTQISNKLDEIIASLTAFESSERKYNAETLHTTLEELLLESERTDALLGDEARA
jgi:tRNA A-37 threonylcarbamoyl transferase component Bud32